MGTRWVRLGGFLLLSLGAGCLQTPPQPAARLRELSRQGEELSASLDQLEDRLLLSRARISQWAELARRHREVSEISCTGQERHLAAMVELLQKQERRGRRARRLVAELPAPEGLGGPVEK